MNEAINPVEGKIMGKVDNYNLRMARTNLKRLESRYAGFLAGRNPQFVDRLRVRQARNCVAFLESKFSALAQTQSALDFSADRN
jgi:hypothetical protein